MTCTALQTACLVSAEVTEGAMMTSLDPQKWLAVGKLDKEG